MVVSSPQTSISGSRRSTWSAHALSLPLLHDNRNRFMPGFYPAGTRRNWVTKAQKKEEFSDESGVKRPSGAKALVNRIGVMYGLKPVPFTTGVSGICEARSSPRRWPRRERGACRAGAVRRAEALAAHSAVLLGW